MSDLGELRELRASLARAQRELESAHERLESLERSDDPNVTVLTPRAQDKQRRKLIAVGVFSSLGTAALIALLFGVGSLTREPSTPVAVVTAAKPEEPKREPPPPTPPTIVAEPTPPPAPVPPPPVVERAPEPPRQPVRVARVSEPAPVRAREPEAMMGALSIICLPQKCDQITDNGVALGPGHIINRPVPVGPHALTLHNANGETKTMRVDIQAERLKELRVNMHPDPAGVF